VGRTQVFLIVATVIVAALLAGGSGGFQLSCTNNDCYVSGATSFAAVIAAPVLCAFVLFYPQRITTATRTEPVKIVERVVAFFVDYLVLLVATVPILTFLMLLLEAEATGAFRWQFSRSNLRPTDVFAIVVVLLVFVALFAYFYVHARIGRQTVGQYLLGFRMEPSSTEGRRSKLGLNAFLGIVGFCIWPISVFLAAKRDDKAFWWDLRTGMRPTRVA
jgi:hypothetical protein